MYDVSLSVHVCGCSQRPESMGTPGAGDTGGCEWPHVGVGT